MRLSRGFQLAELAIALGLLAGPILYVVGLGQANLRGGQFNVERMSARLMLADLADILGSEGIERIRQAAAAPAGKAFDGILEMRRDALAEPLRKQYGEQIKPFLGRFSVDIREDVDDLPGLVRVSTTVTLANGSKVELRRLVRVGQSSGQNAGAAASATAPEPSATPTVESSPKRLMGGPPPGGK